MSRNQTTLYFCQSEHFFYPGHSTLRPIDKQREYSPNQYSTHFKVRFL